MRIYKLPADLVDQIRAYLATRPYNEVAGAMQYLAAATPVEEPDPGNVEQIRRSAERASDGG